MRGREAVWASFSLLRRILRDRGIFTVNGYTSAIPNSPATGAGSATAVLQKHLTNHEESSKMGDLPPFTHTLEGKEDCLTKHPPCDQRADTQLKQTRGVERIM